MSCLLRPTFYEITVQILQSAIGGNFRRQRVPLSIRGKYCEGCIGDPDASEEGLVGKDSKCISVLT
jgi:hypothetical protein